MKKLVSVFTALVMAGWLVGCAGEEAAPPSTPSTPTAPGAPSMTSAGGEAAGGATEGSGATGGATEGTEGGTDTP